MTPMLTRKSHQSKKFDQECKWDYHTESNSKVLNLRNKTVPRYKIDVLVEKETFTHRRRFVCDDCLNKYARDEDETVSTCEFRYEAPLSKIFNLMMRI